MYRSNWSFNIPSRAYPGNLTLCCARGVGNLSVKVFAMVGNLKTAREGWGIWTNCLGVMLPISALVRDENMAEFTERLTLEDFRGQNCTFVCDCKRGGWKSFAPYLLRSVNRSWGQKRISTKWNNGLGADLTYIDLYRSIEIDQKFVFAILKLWRLPSCIYHLGFCDQSLSTV